MAVQKKQIYLDGVHVRIQKITDDLYAITIPLPNDANEVHKNGALYNKLVGKCKGLHTWEYQEDLPAFGQLTKTRTLLFSKLACNTMVKKYCTLERKG